MLESRLAFITTNEGKAREIRELMKPIGIDVVNLVLPELQGDEAFIVREKAMHACAELQRPVFVDDTALCFHAWNGLPGPYISSFMKRLGTLGVYHLFERFDDRRAIAKALICYCEPDKEPIVFEGSVDGMIVEPRRDPDRQDTTSFGWDPIFLPNGYQKTFGEMTMIEKNRISHRGRAVDSFKRYLLSSQETQK